MMTQASEQALSILRDTSLFQWNIVPLFAFVIFFYFSEVEKKNWHAIIAALGAYALEWLAEIGNALILHFSGHSALWTVPGKTAYLILVGLNIEITFMFAIAGLAFTKLAPKNPKTKILHIPNRLFLSFAYAFLGVGVEVILNRWGVLVWEYKFWSWPNVWTIILFAYAPFMVFCFWLYDMKSIRTKLAITIGLFALDIACFIVFAQVLRWI